MARKGRSFELAYKHLYDMLDKNIYKITSPAFPIDKTTGKGREVDVLIEYIDSNGSYSVTETGAGTPTQTTIYMMNSQGNLVEQTTKSGDREISQIKYDAYGNVIQSVSNGVVTKSENIYDRELLTQVKVFDEEGNLMQQRVNTYDQNNMLVLTVITDASGTVISQTEIKYTLCVIEQE